MIVPNQQPNPETDNLELYCCGSCGWQDDVSDLVIVEHPDSSEDRTATCPNCGGNDVHLCTNEQLEEVLGTCRTRKEEAADRLFSKLAVNDPEVFAPVTDSRDVWLAEQDPLDTLIEDYVRKGQEATKMLLDKGVTGFERRERLRIKRSLYYEFIAELQRLREATPRRLLTDDEVAKINQ